MENHPGYSSPVRLNAAEFRRRREAKGMSVAEIARRANIDRTTLFRNLNGAVRYASPVFVQRLLAVLPSECDSCGHELPPMFDEMTVRLPYGNADADQTSVSA